MLNVRRRMLDVRCWMLVGFASCGQYLRRLQVLTNIQTPTSNIRTSILQVNRLIVAVEFHRRRTLLLRAEARFFRAAERQLILYTGAWQIYGQQSGFHAIHELEDT